MWFLQDWTFCQNSRFYTETNMSTRRSLFPNFSSVSIKFAENMVDVVFHFLFSFLKLKTKTDVMFAIHSSTRSDRNNLKTFSYNKIERRPWIYSRSWGRLSMQLSAYKVWLFILENHVIKFQKNYFPFVGRVIWSKNVH